jgi:predicted helicase
MRTARKELAKLNLHALIRLVDYRLFDRRSMAYTPLLVDWGREVFMRHMIDGPNLALVTCRQGVGATWANAFLSNTVGDDSYLSNRSRERGYYFPLYLVGEEGDLLGQSRQVNFDPKFYTAICASAGIDPADQASPDDDFSAATGEARPSEVKVFDYIYGVLHAPNYREAYAEFLKIDFPRIPWPASPEVFAHVSEKGEALRRLHLMEPAAIGDTSYPYHGDGDDVVAAGYPKFEDGKVQINAGQYFDAVPAIAWTFHIGGYQPAQKWLKDRRGRALSWDDIGHYQKIVKILIETDRIMKEIEMPIGEAS